MTSDLMLSGKPSPPERALSVEIEVNQNEGPDVGNADLGRSMKAKSSFCSFQHSLPVTCVALAAWWKSGIRCGLLLESSFFVRASTRKERERMKSMARVARYAR